MRLDDSGFAEAGLDDVRIDRTLHQKVHSTDFLCFLFKDADELLADDLALSLRLGHAGKPGIEALLRVDADKVQVIWTVRSEDCLDLIALVLAQQTMINKDAGQLLADRFG